MKSNKEIIQKIEERARQLGFIKVGFSYPKTPIFYSEFLNWINEKRYGQMTWLKRSKDLREDPRNLFEECKTIISLAYPYFHYKPLTIDQLCMARYTTPKEDDYHIRLKALALILVDLLKGYYPDINYRIAVDSAPLLERSIAYEAGIGFIGKNNMLIIPGFGSYFFLLEILIDKRLDFKITPPLEDGCGNCTNCLDSCPTGALVNPYMMDSSLCLSYLTVEYSGRLPEGTGKNMGRCFLGCDRCQEACPYNRDLGGNKEVCLPSTEEFLKMSNRDFKRRFGKTALSRAGLKKIKRNIIEMLKYINSYNRTPQRA